MQSVHHADAGNAGIDKRWKVLPLSAYISIIQFMYCEIQLVGELRLSKSIVLWSVIIVNVGGRLNHTSPDRNCTNAMQSFSVVILFWGRECFHCCYKFTPIKKQHLIANQLQSWGRFFRKCTSLVQMFVAVIVLLRRVVHLWSCIPFIPLSITVGIHHSSNVSISTQ